MSVSSAKMEALYSKLYSKYTKLKKEKDMDMENLNMEQELKFVNCVAASEQLIEFMRSENARLREQVNDLRSEMASLRVAKDEETIQYQKLLMENNLKIKELSDEIQRLQQLDRERSGFHASTDKGESRQIIAVRDSLPDALDGSTIANKKRRRQSFPSIQEAATLSPREELPTGTAQPSTSSYRYTEPACCRRNFDISGDGAADISPAKCIFQDVFQWLLGMKFSTVMENEELCISALHESSGLSFSLTLIKNASEEPELVYRMLSLGTCERVAPEWMRDTIMFSPTMCAVFFERSFVVVLSGNLSLRRIDIFSHETNQQLPQVLPPLADSGKRFSISSKLAIGGLASIIGMILLSASAIYYLRGRRSNSKSLICWKTESEDHKIEEFMRSYGSHAPKLYNYLDLKKITNTFSHKIGQGGFGQVYKGKLPDGCVVAVKVLTETKGDGEEYINEVASISRTSHVNIVGLLGFCYQRNKRALIYEYVSNGSLDKFLNNGPSGTTCPLQWTTLYRIAVGIARGLEYLHRGCNTRIVHFDIKPHNILLDQDFCPKISDFGLSKLCERKESILSMLGARGTAGYIAPEVYSRTFGNVSHKSDVYSYGMLVLEMVGVRNNVKVSQTSEVYFPDWIYEHLDLGKDLVLQGIMNEADEEMARKMMLVGLWCIQIKPSDRPAIEKAAEMLEGSLHSLQIPPKPVLFSSTISIAESFTSTSTTAYEKEVSVLEPSTSE